MATSSIHNWLRRLGKILRGGRPQARPSGGEKRRIYRVVEAAKPRFRLRPGEEGLSVFDAGAVRPEDVLPAFRQGSSVIALEVGWVESFGLRVVKTPGETRLPAHLRDNHAIIGPGAGMTRKQFKQTLKVLEDAWGAEP